MKQIKARRQIIIKHSINQTIKLDNNFCLLNLVRRVSNLVLASSRKIILMFQEKLALVSDFEFKQPEIGCLSYGATFSLFSIY